MTALHVPTLFVALFAAFLIFGVTFVVARRSLPDCPEVGTWAMGTWLTIAAFVLLILRAVGPEWLSVVGGNGLLFAALNMNCQALHRFVAGKPAPAWHTALVAGNIGATAALLNSPLALRTALVSCLFAVQIIPLVALVATKGWRAEPSLRTVAISLGLTVLALVSRAVHATLRPEEYADFFQASFGNGATYLASYLFPLGAGIGFLLANLERAAGRLRELASHDSLTGCFNRGTFELMLQNACERASRAGDGVSLVLMDMDNFKRINDAHGHQAGDEALRRFARSVRSRLRASDVFGRLGGEEFALVLPGADMGGALALAEQLCAATQALDVRSADGSRIGVTVSVGVSASGPVIGERTWEALYAQADEAMYASKRSGKNRATPYAAPARTTFVHQA